jgi:phage protein D
VALLRRAQDHGDLLGVANGQLLDHPQGQGVAATYDQMIAIAVTALTQSR